MSTRLPNSHCGLIAFLFAVCLPGSLLAEDEQERRTIPPSGPLDLSVIIEREDALEDYYRFNLGADYQIVGQAASDSLINEETAMGGVGRVFGSVMAGYPESKYPGGLFFRLESRDKIATEIAPEDLGPVSLGYLGLTAADWSDIGPGVPELYWKQQFLTKTPVEFRVGRLAPVAYFNVTPFSDNLTGFINLGSIFSPTIPYPSGGSLGAVGWVGFSNNLYLLGTALDANGEWDDWGDLGEKEFFKGIEFGWSEQGTTDNKGAYLLDNLHLSYWHRDATDGGESGQGVSGAYSRWLDEQHLGLFVRAGWSDAEGVSLLEKSASFGVTKNIGGPDQDYTGVAVAWGQAFNSSTDQISTEFFYRFQLSKHFAITPNLQLLINPIANDEDDSIWVVGVRLRANT